MQYRRDNLSPPANGSVARRNARHFVIASLVVVTLLVLVSGISASSNQSPGASPVEAATVQENVLPPPLPPAEVQPPVAVAPSTAVAGGAAQPSPTPTATVVALATTPTDVPASSTPSPTASASTTPSASPSPSPSPTATPSPTPTPTATPAPPVPTSIGVAAFEGPMFEAHNAERAKVNLPPLVSDPQLVSIARLRAKDMIEKQYIGHVSPTGESAFTLLAANNVASRLAAENLVVNGAPDATTVSYAMQGLMDSPGHRANILRPEFTRVGVGVATFVGTKYYVIVFIAP